MFIQAHCAHEISSRPHPSTPIVALANKLIFLLKSFSRILFDDLNHPRNTILWGKAHHNMNMVGLDISFKKFDLRVYLPDLVHFDLQVFNHSVYQGFIPVPWDPYDMIHAPVNTVSLFPNLHVLILSYLTEDLGTHSIYGLTSAELRR